MQLTLHATCATPHGVSHLVQAMSAWSVKTPRAPSQQCGDARVCGHTTTAMHDMSTPPLAVSRTTTAVHDMSTPPLAVSTNFP